MYIRKRDNLSNTNVIPSTVAAESVLAVWREKPHLAKYKRNEFFDKYYADIFADLNAAQMIMAVLIFRFCDSMRKCRGGGYKGAGTPPLQSVLSCISNRQKSAFGLLSVY
ncbi:MAG: AIPR family protein [Lachnospiraceae bacterium]